jgi:hypothetical protein
VQLGMSALGQKRTSATFNSHVRYYREKRGH